MLFRSGSTYQAVEKGDLLSRLWRNAYPFVIAAYRLYASFLRIRAACISSFCTGPPAVWCFNGPLQRLGRRDPSHGLGENTAAGQVPSVAAHSCFLVDTVLLYFRGFRALHAMVSSAVLGTMPPSTVYQTD